MPYKVSTCAVALSLLLWMVPPAGAQQLLPDEPEPLGIALENFPYPHPVSFLALQAERHDVRLAYMDVRPADPNGRAVVLFHGKNFFGAYWDATITALVNEGFRVVVPDQIGFGKSSKPPIPYSFHMMGHHTEKLLDTLGIEEVAAVGHSMGGMVATRFALMFPERTTHLVLENPIGLEDYGATVPYVPTEDIYQSLLERTEEGIRAQHEAYYVEWKTEFETYVQVHYRWTLSGEYPRFARAAALTTQMVMEQPVVHEFPDIEVPTLLVIGQEDRTAPGAGRLPEHERDMLGQYPELGRTAAAAIPGAELVEMHEIGHTPHFEDPDSFHEVLLDFLSD